MKRGWLALLALLGALGLARGEYVILITNVGEKIASTTGSGPSSGPTSGPSAGPPGPKGPPMPNGGPRSGTGDTTFDQPEPGAGAILVTAIVEVSSAANPVLNEKNIDLFHSEKGGVIPIAYRRHPDSPEKPAILSIAAYEAIPQSPGLEVAAAFRMSKDTPLLSSIAKRYFNEHTRVFSGASGHPEARKVLDLARWCLEHGLLDKFAETMDSLNTADDKKLEQVAIYLELKDKLKEPLRQPAETEKRTRLFDGYNKTTKAPHFVVYSDGNVTQSNVDSRLNKMEDTFKAVYYWFALKGQRLSLPAERQTVLICSARDREFQKLQKNLSGGTQVVDGFFCRRENIVVLNPEPLDAGYGMLLRKGATKWENGYSRSNILAGDTSTKAFPSSATQVDKINATGMALMIRTLENDAETASVTHMVGRQLSYAASVLPRNVIAPEWVQFGAGSFFETPSGAPWVGYTGPSPLYMPAFRDLQGGKKDLKLEATPLDTLKAVVKDQYFREAGGTSAEKAALLRRARATSWALTYYLMQERLDDMRAFYHELAKMPRDMELDGEVVWSAFVRTVGGDAKAAELADRWFKFMTSEKLDCEELVRNVEELKTKVKTLTPADSSSNGSSGNPPPPMPGR
jgi:hypothetical protein